MKNIVLSTLAFFFTGFLCAQAYNPDAVNKKAVFAYDKALEQLNTGELKQAIPLLNKAIELDARYEDAYLTLGSVYGELLQYQQSVDAYEKAKSIDSIYVKYQYINYATNLAGLGRFADALQAVNTFLAIPNLGEKSLRNGNYRKKCFEFALSFAATHPASNYSFAPQNLGDSINSPQAEYYPSFTIDDSTFVFTRRAGGIREDFIKSTLTAKGYSKANALEGELNTEPSKGAINISQDGQWLIYAGNFPGKGSGDFDLFISLKTKDGWSKPYNLGYSINTEFWESSPSLSPDKTTLYFSSNRTGGYGGKDLYVSTLQPDGKWTPAKNMGPDINTAGDELAPFIHADNQTLYYTSNGLTGYGGTDIYVIRKDWNNQWGKPENLGYPVNTIENEGSLFVASDGITAYYASDRADTRGELDLYKFTLPVYTRPERTLYVKGNVTDAATGLNLKSTVELTDDSSRTKITQVQTDASGYYFITLPVGRNYTFTVNQKGYLFYSDVFALAKNTSDSVYIKNIALQPVALNKSVTLSNIQFAVNAYSLEPVSLIELDKLLQLLNENPTIKIQVSGHTDNTGDAGANLKLSDNRAKAVVDYLVSKGIDIKRLTWKGFGSSKPVAQNNTEEGRALNRRTEFTITGL